MPISAIARCNLHVQVLPAALPLVARVHKTGGF
jgi:hypothetical protein